MNPFRPEVGTTANVSFIVGPEHTAAAFGNPGVDVLATPMLLDFIEIAAGKALASALPADWTTLGTGAWFRHLKPTPLGFTVTATATIIEVDRQRVRFHVEVRDEIELVGDGEHERFCLPTDRYRTMIQQKQSQR